MSFRKSVRMMQDTKNSAQEIYAIHVHVQNTSYSISHTLPQTL